MAGLAVRATLLRPGRSAVRDATGFPPAATQTIAEDGVELRVIALPGVLPPLALVRWPAAPGDDLELLAADLADGGTRAAIALIAATVAIGRRAGAGGVRCAPSVPQALDRAAHLLAFGRDHAGR